ncbi:aspartyl-phosphate phosphatase Spo0E family protein [Jeotgalibacillus sp. S-D1]|uniref:aspartyl-phosphate phosphatase Spo0E family protein n=1 Tax=Jeotgalibacillus sp. S-D1 TaxID=2552189 RepID=UPI0010597D38|nr:aspartyl-phosphate phosphatase Spo0E family protein [Jeotgalibacillus sp. S-D1]TDL34947.1 aspartyl-phosphate phosphatase Spo0E family protein [Jeotgalibacillus sp. S-D1]
MADQYRLLNQIEKKRQVLIYVVAKEGLTSPLAVQYSQELDDLLNRYDRLFTNNTTAPTSFIQA